MISDGMGTGTAANRDSKAVIETLEELLEVDWTKRAVQLLQSIFVFWPEKERYSTLDYLQIDLHAGIGSFLNWVPARVSLSGRDRWRWCSFQACR